MASIRIEDLKNRWSNLHDKHFACASLFPDIPNSNLYFKNKLKELNEIDMENLMLQLEAKDDELATMQAQLEAEKAADKAEVAQLKAGWKVIKDWKDVADIDMVVFKKFVKVCLKHIAGL